MSESVEQRKAESAKGAADNSQVGVDGDDPSHADTRDDGDTPADGGGED